MPEVRALDFGLNPYPPGLASWAEFEGLGFGFVAEHLFASGFSAECLVAFAADDSCVFECVLSALGV